MFADIIKLARDKNSTFADIIKLARDKNSTFADIIKQHVTKRGRKGLLKIFAMSTVYINQYINIIYSRTVSNERVLTLVVIH